MLTYSVAIAAGILSHAVFVGGATFVYAVTMPMIRQPYVPVPVQLRQWAYMYTQGLKIMVTATIVSTLAYSCAALLAEAGSSLRWAAAAAALLAIAILPLTMVLMRPVNNKLLKLLELENEADILIQAPALLKKWNSYHLVRLLVSSLGFINAVAILAGFYV